MAKKKMVPVTIRFPIDIHKMAADEAKRTSSSFNATVIRLIEDAFFAGTAFRDLEQHTVDAIRGILLEKRASDADGA